MSRTPKHERQVRKWITLMFRDVGKHELAILDAEQRERGRRYRFTINLPLGKYPAKVKNYRRTPGMKPLLHNGGKPRV